MSTFDKLPYMVANLSKELNEVKTLIKELNPKKESELLTPVQVMEMLQISKPTFHRYTRDNVIPVLKVGGNVRVKRSELEKFLNQ